MLLVQPTSFGNLSTVPDWWARTLFGTERAVRVGGHMWRVFSLLWVKCGRGPRATAKERALDGFCFWGEKGRILAYGGKCMT